MKPLHEELRALAEEMRRDLVGGMYPDGPLTPTHAQATVLYRLWHGPGPGMEGFMSIATVEHIGEYASRFLALAARAEREHITASERETVAKVVAAIRTAASQIEMAMEPRTNEDYSVMDNAIVAILKQAAALAPIAEGK